MEKQGTQLSDEQIQDRIIFLLLLLLFGLGFFLRNTHFQLFTDDISWLRGEAPTVFDQYRYIPRFFFLLLHYIFGPSVTAALTMIFIFHLANSFLVSRLALELLNSRIAAKVATLIFLINPITLSTLTWISCFSYILGTSLALTSLLAAWKGDSEDTNKPLLWWLIALACYAAGLFCSHELFFLPIIFLLFGWLHRDTNHKPLSRVFFVLAMTFAMLVNFFVYGFGRYGVREISLLTPGFISAFASSALSFGLSLGVAYPLSFFIKTQDFLRICFSAPIRWGMSLMLIGAGILWYRPNKSWRLSLSLAFSFVTLITPYIIRLYLMLDKINYHISYVLTGRVFYLPFTIIALIWGGIIAHFHESRVKENKLTKLLPFLCAVAYFYALLVLYDRTDFMGLQVLQGPSQGFPPPWSPYINNHPAWFAGSVLVLIAIVGVRFVIEKSAGMKRTKHETSLR